MIGKEQTMRDRLVYICSPCRGDMKKNIIKAQNYCREAVELWPDVIPIAPHVYFTQFLDDTKPDERVVGMNMGIALLSMCDEIWVYGIENPSEGMKNEIVYAQDHGIPVRNAAEVYQDRAAEVYGERNENQDNEIGDALIILPSQADGLKGVAVIESTTLRISGEAIVDMAIQLRRHRGHDITVEVDQ